MYGAGSADCLLVGMVQPTMFLLFMWWLHSNFYWRYLCLHCDPCHHLPDFGAGTADYLVLRHDPALLSLEQARAEDDVVSRLYR